MEFVRLTPYIMWWIAQRPVFDDETYVQTRLIAGPFLQKPTKAEWEAAKRTAPYPHRLTVVYTGFSAVEDDTVDYEVSEDEL